MKDLWTRASLEMNTRPIRVERNIGRKDLLIPRGPGTLRMAALTLVGGVSAALLFVWPPLMILAIVSPVGGGVWLLLATAAAAVVAWVTLFTLAVRESAADRRYAAQL